MSMPGEDSSGALRLFAEFPIPSLEDWRREVEALLRGAPFDQKMLSSTPEGITIHPLYTRGPDPGDGDKPERVGREPAGRGDLLPDAKGAAGAWEIVQEISSPTAEQWNEIARADLAEVRVAPVIQLDSASRNGLDPIEADIGSVGLDGTSLATIEDFARALRDVPAPLPIFLRGGPAAGPAAALLLAHLRTSMPDLRELRGSLGTDPLADALAGSPAPLADSYDRLAALTSWSSEQAPSLLTLLSLGSIWHDAGGSAVDELAFSLAGAIHTLREMEARGLAPGVTAPRLLFSFAAGPRMLVEIAKLRAARILWSQVTHACGCGETGGRMQMHVRTAARNLSAIDLHSNLLRTTTEALAAVLGGCDALTVLPFDHPLGPPSELARRMARNTQLILREEAHLDWVLDAAGGSWCLESLTDELAEKAWDLFRDVEAHGGMRSCLETGWAQARIHDEATSLRHAVAMRGEVLIGTNRYPNPDEPRSEPKRGDLDANRVQRAARMRARSPRDEGVYKNALESLAERAEGAHTLREEGKSPAAPDLAAAFAAVFEGAIEAARSGATLGSLARAWGSSPAPAANVSGGRPRLLPLPSLRLSEDFERLRATVRALQDLRAGRGEDRPDVFLMNLGPASSHLPRLEFTRAFFALGGFRVAEEAGLATAAAAAEAAIHSRAPIAVIVGSDKSYPEAVPAIASSIKATYPDCQLVLAGLPVDWVEGFRRAGVDEFIHLQADVPAVLSALADRLRERS